MPGPGVPRPNETRIETRIVHGECVASQADCCPAGCSVKLCSSCELRLLFPAMRSGDYLITNADGTEPTMATSASLAVEVLLLRLKGVGAPQQDGMKPQLIDDLQTKGRALTMGAQAVRVQ